MAMAERGKEEKLREEIEQLEKEMAATNFWQDKDRAQGKVKEYNRLKEQIANINPYDAGNAIMTIFAGAGGDDAEDFAAMLFNMYERFMERKGWERKILHKNENAHGGYRNLTVEIRGRGAYGVLKNES